MKQIFMSTRIDRSCRKAFLERARQHQSELENPSGGSNHARNQSEAAYFPVGLFVAAVGQGVLDPGTPNRVLERLQHASSKVPKEQVNFSSSIDFWILSSERFSHRSSESRFKKRATLRQKNTKKLSKKRKSSFESLFPIAKTPRYDVLPFCC